MQIRGSLAACSRSYLPSQRPSGCLLEPLRFNRPAAPEGSRTVNSALEIRRGTHGEGETDAEADMLSAEASSAICVQRFDGSRNSAIHTTYRISLRSSSLREPRYPLLRVVFGYMLQQCCSNIALETTDLVLIC